VIGAVGPAELRCSRSGCREPATTTVNWRNPAIHSIDRVKVWLACDEHRAFFQEYFENRGFPVVLTPVGVTVEAVS